MFPYIASLLFGYAVGSIPTAYLLVKWKSRVDIRTAGSGNVGAMNSFDVTRSKWLGIAVFLIDMLKGSIAVLCSMSLFGSEFWISGASGAGAVLGHNYPVWLRFKGGRGLSTGVGVMLFIAWIVIPVWCLVWTIHYAISKNIHYANITSSLVTPIALLVSPARWLIATLPTSTGVEGLLLFTPGIFLLIIIKHFEFIRQHLNSFNQ